MSEWYRISEEDALDTPGVVVYRDRIKANIDTLTRSIDDVNRLRPHIKTHKSPDVTRMLLDAGVRKFKCATLAEAEMLGAAGAPDVLLAHQPVGPKLQLLRELTQSFRGTAFSTLVDNIATAASLNVVFAEEPPPGDHPFWRHPQVTVTPHVAAATDPATAATVIAANIRAFR